MSFRIPLSAPDIGPDEIDAVNAVLRRPQLSLGPELAAFEREFAELHGVPDAVAVSSGTAGLHLSLVVLGIGPGDEVIVPSFTFVAVANAVLHVGAIPVFADVDPVTLNLDPACVRDLVGSRTRAILVVHTFGVPAKMDELEAIAREYELALIEDACEALGAQSGSKPVGAFGDAAVFGFYPNKQITTGEGGAVLVRNKEHAARLRSLRNQGRTPGADWLDHREPGYNYRLPELACAMGRVQLRRLPEFLSLRAAAASRYDELLRKIPGIELPPLIIPAAKISWFVYVVRLPKDADRDRVQSLLADRGIATGRYFPPVHLQPAWRLRSDPARFELTVTESIAPRTLALPFFNQIHQDQQRDVADELMAAIASSIHKTGNE